MKRWIGAALAAAAMIGVGGQALASPSCAEGAYRGPDGRLAVLTAPAKPGGPLRYTLLDGRRGDLGEAGSPLTCAEGRLGEAAGGVAWRRIPLRETSVRFKSGNAVLNGLLIERAGLAHPPLVVLVHGSESTSPLRLYRQLMFAAQGVSAFAYDKRGTGGSEGAYTQDFKVLAEDGANAARAARRVAAGRYRRLGFYGGSQGGWVAPLAALKARADFVVVGFGVVGTAVEQDAWQVDYQLGEAGFGPETLPQVHEVTRATGAVARSDFRSGMGQVEALKALYASAPWLSKIDGQYSGELLAGKLDQARAESPQVPWDYTGLDTLRALHVPQLWVFARDDDTAPSAPSIQRLQELQRAGAPIRIMVYPNSTHGMYRVSFDASGARKTSPDAVDGFLRLIADFAKGAVRGRYGEGQPVGTAR